jgi:ribosome-associated protein
MPDSSQVSSSTSSVAATSHRGNPPIDLQDPSLRLAQAIARAAEERKGTEIVLLRVTEVSPLADYFVIVTGFSKVQVRAIARSIEEKVEETLQREPLRIEGQAEGTWILMDYGDVIVHTMLPQEREFYSLEAFWGHAERINVAALAS